MAVHTQTVVELEHLNQNITNEHHTNRARLPSTALQTPANTTSGQSGPLMVASDIETVRSPLSTNRAAIVIIQLAGINFITSFSNGLVTVGLPAMAEDLNLPSNLLLWPMNAYAITSASCLLLAGAVADIIGTRKVNLVGCFFIAVFILVSAISRTGIQLIMFRAMHGVGGAMALPSSLSIISKSIASGRPRNIGFGCLGLAMPLGFSFGMVLAGVFIDGPGWRIGFYLGGAVSFLLFTVGIWALPKDVPSRIQLSTWKRLATEIDWIGAALASTAIALFSYVLA